MSASEEMNSSEEIRMPQKKYYRQRAHSNPLSVHALEFPLCPENMDWGKYYPHYFTDKNSLADEPVLKRLKTSEKRVEFADIGCGYGGLLVDLATMFPDTLMLGMEIRVKVSEYVKKKIEALRLQNAGQYQNVACIRGNAMKHLPNFFHKGQLKKMFFLFPDPHFKKKKNKWRIISPSLLAIYAYTLDIGAKVYTITDVEELHIWMKEHFNDHPLFRELEKEEYKDDPVVDKVYNSTEEGKKVARNKGNKYFAMFERIEDPFEKQRDSTVLDETKS
ncbi:tRNA (guanine-N(7)-)-methyltransferase B-like [Rhopilema esculentum]|uniref:tRNA (guanine-N(7)-)-methyltransferase B-like n=1 Tax=Rhopilema esculentum TaxID=499914 RepID=UPI0031D51737|eukprot:gene12756-3484_t